MKPLALNPQRLPFLEAKALWQQLDINSSFGNLRSLAGISKDHFNALYLPAITTFSERVQLAPASMSHHHSYIGGLLLHTLDVAELALKLRRGYHLPLGAEPEDINQLQHIYSYAVFALGLLHDAGKALVNVKFIDADNPHHEPWNPLGQPCTNAGFDYYKIDYIYPVPYKLHQKISPSLLAWLPDIGRHWLASHRLILGQVLSALYGDVYEAGIFGEILQKADGHSVARDMKIDTTTLTTFAVPRVPVQERILTALRQIFEKRTLSLNKAGATGWVDSSGEFIYLVCRPVAGAIVEQLHSEGVREIPTDPVKIFDLMQDHGMAVETADGKAIWRILVTQGEFEHKFTCLKLETRRFFLPNHRPQPFAGRIKILETTDQHLNNEVAQPLVVTQTTHAVATASTSEMVHTLPRYEGEPELHLSGVENLKPPGPSAEESGQRPANFVDFDDEGAGQFFVEWLIKGIHEKTLNINQRTASLHIVNEGLGLVSPQIFKLFCEQHTIKNSTKNVPDYKLVQRRFQRLRLNRKTAANLNVHIYHVVNKEGQRAANIQLWLLPLDLVYKPPAQAPKTNDFIKRPKNPA